MFLTRLRRHAKWVFVLLALVFGLGFVAFGVGAGGVGFGDIFKGGGGGSAASVSDAKEKTEQNPADVQAWRDLATAYQTEGASDEAVAALTQASAVAPKDTDVLRELAAAYQTQALDAQQKLQIAQVRAAYRAPTDPAGGLQVKGTNVLGVNPITAAAQAVFNTEATAIASTSSGAGQSAVETFERIVALQPDDPNVRLELAQAAENVGNREAAIGAYQAFLRLAPDDPSASLVKDRLTELRTPPAGQ